MANIISYNDVIEILQDIARRNYLINSFFLGRDWELENNEDIVYPCFQVYPEFARMPISQNGEYKTLEVTLNCKVFDLVRQSESNEQDVHSDMLRVAQYIINELNQHPFYIRSNASIVGDINLTALEEFEDDFTAGWNWQINLRLINQNIYCGIPVEEITGYSANGPVSTGYSVDVQYLTCTTVTGCTSFQNYIATYSGSSGGGSAVINGLNTYTGGTFALTSVNISGGTVNNWNVTGGTLSSGGTDLYSIFITTVDGNDITRVQPGSNIQTGGTGNLPTISLVASPSVNNLTVSGAIETNYISGYSTSSSLIDLSSSAVTITTDNGGFLTPYMYVNTSQIELAGLGGTGLLLSSGHTHLTSNDEVHIHSASIHLDDGVGITRANNFSATTITGTTIYVSGYNAVNPGISNAIDTNTGFMFDGPDTVSIHTGGIQRLLINSDGTITNGAQIINSPFETYLSGDTRTDNLSANTLSAQTITATNLRGFAGNNINVNNSLSLNTDVVIRTQANTNQIDLDNTTYPSSIILSDDNGLLAGQYLMIDSNSGTFTVKGVFTDIQGSTTRLTATSGLEGIMGGVYIWRTGTVAAGTITTVGSAATLAISSASAKVNPGIYNSVIAGGSGITADTSSTLFAPNARLAETSGSVIYSAGTPLESIFALTGSLGDITRVQPGSNITTGGTDNFPTISIVPTPSLAGLSTSGNVNVNSGRITSGGTDLYSIFQPAGANSVIGNGLNTYTGGTFYSQTINISAATLNNIVVSGTSQLDGTTCTTLSGGTISATTYIGQTFTATTTSAHTVDWSISTNYYYIITGNTTFDFSNTKNGQTITVAVNNDSATGATSSWPTTASTPALYWQYGVTPIQTTGTTATDIYTFMMLNNKIYGVYSQGYLA